MSRKGENIYKRKDSRWEARYIKGYRPDGRVKYGYCYGKTYTEAKEKVNKLKAETFTGIQLEKPNTDRFEFYCDEWLRLNRSRVSESTFVKYTTITNKHIKAKLGSLQTAEISTVVAERFSHELLCVDMLSPKTVRDILSVLRSIIKYVTKHYPSLLSVVDIVYPKNPKKEMRVLTKEEQTRFVEFLSNDIDSCKFGVLLSLLTGMRIGEVCALKWRDINLPERFIRVSHTMQRLKNLTAQNQVKTKILISDPKSDSSSRIIPLTSLALKLCTNQYVRNPEAFVLTGSTERYIEPRSLQNKLKKYTKECGLNGVHFHVLRHTFATRCVEVGFEIKSLSEILGHASPQITLERYVHSSLELKRQNMEKLIVAGY